jgi:ribosomal protein S18 acetylase RimI-like enzyme
MDYKVNKASSQDILVHLMSCDNSFIPPLSETVDLPSYAEKLKTRATTFEIWNQSKLIGCVACYFDNPEDVFVTNVSVLPDHTGKGYARFLLKQAVEYGRVNGKKKALLEVYSQNQNAILFYQKIGFKEYDKTAEINKLKLNLIEHEERL